MNPIRRVCVVLVGVLAMTPLAALAQTAAPDPLAPVSQLVGDWTGVGEGEPGVSAATRHAARVQNGRFVMVERRSVYPKQDQNKSGEVHTSIDIWSYDRARKVIVLRQFDSLGFVSTYVQDRAAGTDRRIVMVSEQMENVPRGLKARYTYEFVAPDEYRERFELDPDGKGLKTYVFGRYLRDRTD